VQVEVEVRSQLAVVGLLDREEKSRLDWRWQGSQVRGWVLGQAMGAVRALGVAEVVLPLGMDCRDEGRPRADSRTLM
jgi:hypothetical protein